MTDNTGTSDINMGKFITELSKLESTDFLALIVHLDLAVKVFDKHLGKALAGKRVKEKVRLINNLRKDIESIEVDINPTLLPESVLSLLFGPAYEDAITGSILTLNQTQGNVNSVMEETTNVGNDDEGNTQGRGD